MTLKNWFISPDVWYLYWEMPELELLSVQKGHSFCGGVRCTPRFTVVLVCVSHPLSLIFGMIRGRLKATALVCSKRACCCFTLTLRAPERKSPVNHVMFRKRESIALVRRRGRDLAEHAWFLPQNSTRITQEQGGRKIPGDFILKEFLLLGNRTRDSEGLPWTTSHAIETCD